jgi:hypothetical protein
MSAARVKLVVGLVVVAGVAFAAYLRLYAQPRAALLDESASLRNEVGLYEDALSSRRGASAALGEIAGTTLGATPAQIEGRLRTALGEIARDCGLEDVVPNSGSPRAAVNPAARSSPRLPRSFTELLERQADFYVVEGSLTGVGTLDEALRTLATVQAQAWAHRVGAVTVRPVGMQRDQFELRIDRIATLLMPDLADPDAPAPGWRPLSEADALRWASITDKNIYRLPEAPPEPEPVAEAPPPPPPAGPAYGDWKLTGVTRGSSGIRVEMVNLRDSRQISLEVGEAVLDAQLAEVGRFSALFKIGDSLCEVGLGQTLAQRREIP